MNKGPCIGISIRMPPEQWSQLNDLVQEKKFASVSEAVRSFVELGKWLYHNKGRFENEEEITKIQQEWTSQMNEQANLEWLQSLSDTQIDGVKMAINLETERRIKNR